jgi:hypothetical protein
MRPDPHSVRGHAIVLAAAMITLCSCSDEKVPAQLAPSGDEPARVTTSGDEPAQVILLTGPTARWFLDLDPPPPPDGRIVVAGNDDGAVFAFVLGEHLEGAKEQFDDLRISGEVEGCDLGGTTCCDVQRKTFVLDSMLENQRVWLSLGERCEGLPPEERFDDGPPVNERIANVVELTPEIVSAMAAYGATYPFMTLAEDTGNGRILEDPSYEESELEQASPMISGLPLRQPSSVIPAGHVISSRPRCVGSVGSCKQDEGDRCNGGRAHWFRWNDRKGEWCQMSDRCRC